MVRTVGVCVGNIVDRVGTEGSPSERGNLISYIVKTPEGKNPLEMIHKKCN